MQSTVKDKSLHVKKHNSCLFTESKPRVCGVVSVPKCGFNRVTMQFSWGYTSACVFCEFAGFFQGTSLEENLNLFFEKVLLCLIVHFKGTWTYFYHCFVHDSQIFNILQLLLTICISSYICVNCVQNLSCFFFFSIIEYDPNKLCFHDLE